MSQNENFSYLPEGGLFAGRLGADTVRRASFSVVTEYRAEFEFSSDAAGRREGESSPGRSAVEAVRDGMNERSLFFARIAHA